MPTSLKVAWSPGSCSTAASAGDLEQPLLPSSRRVPSDLPRLATERRSWHCRSAAKAVLLILIGAAGGAVGTTLLAAAKPLEPPYAVVPPPPSVPREYLAAQPLSNSCLLPNLVIPDGPQTFDACQFVITSTDEIWNVRGDVDAAIDKYFHESYYNAGSWGRRGIGIAELKQAVFGEMRAFPDIRIHITDCSCQGNDLDGYKCMMPDVLEGTNTGPSAWGPATNRYARWNGLVESLVKRNEVTGQWQYIAEWGVHDEWALIQQLGLDFARVPHPASNNELIHDCTPLLNLGQKPEMNAADAAILAVHV